LAPRPVAEPEAFWRASGQLGEAPNRGTALVLPASFILALTILLLATYIIMTDTPMDVDDPESLSGGLPFPGEVVDGEQTVQYLDM
jgi:hypothetical protein